MNGRLLLYACESGMFTKYIRVLTIVHPLCNVIYYAIRYLSDS